MTGYKQPPLRRTVNIPSTGANAIMDALTCGYRGGKSWQALGDEIGIPGIVVYRAILFQKYPHNRNYRQALGLVKPRKTRKVRNAKNMVLGAVSLASKLTKKTREK